MQSFQTCSSTYTHIIPPILYPAHHFSSTHFTKMIVHAYTIVILYIIASSSSSKSIVSTFYRKVVVLGHCLGINSLECWMNGHFSHAGFSKTWSPKFFFFFFIKSLLHSRRLKVSQALSYLDYYLHIIAVSLSCKMILCLFMSSCPFYKDVEEVIGELNFKI
jgi:hypothetical protein